MSPRPSRKGASTRSAPREPAASGRKPLSDDVLILEGLVHELEGQLGRLAELRSALQADLSGEKQRADRLDQEAERLSERIENVSTAAPDDNELTKTIASLTAERTKVFEERRHLEQRLRGLARQRDDGARESQSLSAELERRHMELESVESQLARALDVLGGLQIRLREASRDRDSLGERVKAEESRVAELEKERDELLEAVSESRAMLEALTRSLAKHT